MDYLKIIEHLKEKEKSFSTTTVFSDKPGIYAFFFIGDQFPHFNKNILKHKLIYIGKTESSQKQRDANTHFGNDQTGSSTVRRSIGALLQETYSLTPIARNDKDYSEGRFSYFKFISEDERVLTKWMKENLALSFYEFTQSVEQLDLLETQVIQELIPILNIDYKNPDNPYKKEIKRLRKICASQAQKDFSLPQKIKLSEKITPVTSKSESPMTTSRENQIIIDNVTELDEQKAILRITAPSKFLFPNERPGTPVTYKLETLYNNESYISTYTIGSKDGKIRSGVLKLDKELYREVLKIRPDSVVRIKKTNKGIYQIL